MRRQQDFRTDYAALAGVVAGLVESVSPLVKVLGEVEFFSLVERIFSMPEVKGMVMEVINAHNVTEQLGGD